MKHLKKWKEEKTQAKIRGLLLRKIRLTQKADMKIRLAQSCCKYRYRKEECRWIDRAMNDGPIACPIPVPHNRRVAGDP